jgi:hypothetical protein
MTSARFVAFLIVALVSAASAKAGNNDAPLMRPAIGGGHYADGHGA